MEQTYLVFLVSLVVLFFMGGTFVFFYLRSLKQELDSEWELALDKLRYRLDKIPNLIETVRPVAVGHEQFLRGIVLQREELWPGTVAGVERVQKELNLSLRLHEIWDLAQKFPELQRDVNFLSLRTEFREVGKDIESLLGGYNNQVREYNRKVKSFLLRPFSFLFRFRKLQVFEFES